MDADMGDSFADYWETQRYLESEELVDSIYVGATEDAMSFYDSSSQDGSHSSSTPAGAAMGGPDGAGTMLNAFLAWSACRLQRQITGLRIHASEL